MPSRLLFRNDGISIVDIRCDGFDSRGDERLESPGVTFVQSGAFCVESERGRALADPTRAVLWNAGEPYRVTHPGPCNDRCVMISLSLETLREIRASIAPRLAERTGFARLVTPCGTAAYAAQRRLAGRLSRGEDALAVAEEALRVVASLFGESWRARAKSAGHERDEDERVAAVRALLAHRYGERMSLAEVGEHVRLSPYRIARLFRAATGSTIHGHRIELRLRAAVNRLVDGESDLTGLALDLGFADHAHFTNTFRRRFGVAPSRFRAGAALPN